MSVRYSGQANGFNKLVVPQLSTVQTVAVQNILRNLVTWANNLASPNPASGDVLTIKTGVGKWFAAGGGGTPLIWQRSFGYVMSLHSKSVQSNTFEVAFSITSAPAISVVYSNNSITLPNPVKWTWNNETFTLGTSMAGYSNSVSIISVCITTELTITPITYYIRCQCSSGIPSLSGPSTNLPSSPSYHEWMVAPKFTTIHDNAFSTMLYGGTHTFKITLPYITGYTVGSPTAATVSSERSRMTCTILNLAWT